MTHALAVNATSRKPRSCGRNRLLEQAGSLMAVGLLAVMAGMTILEQQAIDTEQASSARKPPSHKVGEAARAETLVAGYLGAPYTYPSDVRIQNPAAKTDVTVKHVGWDGKPFKHPIYYGLRVARWGAGNRSGYMVDFTHSKTITRRDETVDLTGIIDGAPAATKARIGEMFKHLEFSHGHNMVTFNGLFRLASLAPRLSPYVGVGVGVALPHTEVMMRGEPKRTYEYQYAGPTAQALAGIEIRLGATSVFFEYKFTFADYRVPLSQLEGHLLVTDLWRQLNLWWQGKTPPGGELSTRLSSHNFIGGAGYRF